MNTNVVFNVTKNTSLLMTLDDDDALTEDAEGFNHKPCDENMSNKENLFL